MGISSALNNAASGLAASARLADTISNNVANAMTEGFARRSIEVTSLSLGGLGTGVRTGAATRAENAYLTAERRSLDASLGAAAARSGAYDRLLTALGEPGDAGALSTLATALETTLMAATASPQATTKLSDAVTAAGDVATALNRIAAETQALRTDADSEIAAQVDTVNAALRGIDALNRRIASLAPQGVDVTALADERSRLVDTISPIIPVKVAKRENGAIAVYSAGGGVLLDGRVYELGFTKAANAVTADQSVGAGLSGLSQDRGAQTGPDAVAVGTGRGIFDGGSLSALFEVRDTVAPEVGRELDAYANDLIERFRDLMPAAALDGSGRGLFVESGPGGTTGLASRIAINAAVDPGAGGAVWRLRDGLSAAAPGSEGNGSVLQAWSDAMSALRAPAGFVSQSASNGAATIASEITSFFAGRAARSDEDRAFLTARQTTLSEEEMHATGVDSDSELQSMMLVEQAYAANARVLSVIDDLMKLLLEV